jgi:hypothetical protein
MAVGIEGKWPWELKGIVWVFGNCPGLWEISGSLVGEISGSLVGEISGSLVGIEGYWWGGELGKRSCLLFSFGVIVGGSNWVFIYTVEMFFILRGRASPIYLTGEGG